MNLWIVYGAVLALSLSANIVGVVMLRHFWKNPLDAARQVLKGFQPLWGTTIHLDKTGELHIAVLSPVLGEQLDKEGYSVLRRLRPANLVALIKSFTPEQHAEFTDVFQQLCKRMPPSEFAELQRLSEEELTR